MSQKHKRRSKRHKRGAPGSPGPAQVLNARVMEIGRHGDGIAVPEEEPSKQQKYFVPHTLPGERVSIRAAGNRADLLEVIEPSADRVPPFCPHYQRCGGCSAQHMSDAFYRNWKKSIVETAFENRELETAVDEISDAHGEGRRRVTFHAILTQERVKVGFMKPKSRQLTEIGNCPILVPALKDAPQIAHDLGLAFIGSVRSLDISFTETTAGIDCDIRGTDDLTYDMHVDLAEAANKWDLARLTLEGVVELERRKPYLRVDDCRVPVPPAGFLQATTEGEAFLTQQVLELTQNAKKIADLFCGVGPFALRQARHAQVYAADSNEQAVQALKEGAHATPGLKQVDAEVRDLFRNPLYRDDLDAFDAVILNPARAGALAQATEISHSEVPLVVYVSCDPATLARDADILTDGGYELVRLMPVDQFKYTAHIETIAVFRKAD